MSPQRPSRPAKTAYFLVNLMLVLLLLSAAVVTVSTIVGLRGAVTRFSAAGRFLSTRSFHKNKLSHCLGESV